MLTAESVALNERKYPYAWTVSSRRHMTRGMANDICSSSSNIPVYVVLIKYNQVKVSGYYDRVRRVFHLI